MDYTASANFPITGDRWGIRYLQIALLMLLGITVPAVAGYLLAVSETVREHSPEPEWPTWDNFLSLYSNGLRFLLNIFLYCLPLLLFFVVMLVLAAVAIGKFETNSSADELATFYAFAVLVVMIIVSCLYSLLLAAVMPALAVSSLSDSGWFFGFSFSRLKSILTANPKNYWGVAGIGWACYLLCGTFGSGMLLVVLAYLVSPYLLLFVAHLWGQLARTNNPVELYY